MSKLRDLLSAQLEETPVQRVQPKPEKPKPVSAQVKRATKGSRFASLGAYAELDPMLLMVKSPESAAMRRFGLDPDAYLELARAQGYVCAICKSKNGTKNLAVDHCHDSGRARGLLCSNCNTALGGFKDNIELLERAIEYLQADVDHRLSHVRGLPLDLSKPILTSIQPTTISQ